MKGRCGDCGHLFFPVLLLLQACSPAVVERQIETPGPVAMKFHRLKVEPQVHSSYPTYRRYHDALAPQVVVITVDGLERIGWEDRPTNKASWILRLPEQVYVNGKKLHYQVGMQWELEGTRWSYTGSPVKDLNGLWKKDPSEGFYLDPAAQQKPVLGHQAASIYADSTGAHYRVAFSNGSDELWRDVFTWICLDHFHTPVTGYRPYLKVGSSWTEYQKIPNVGPGTFLAVEGREDEYSRVRPRAMLDPLVSFPGVVCWNITDKGHLLTAHLSNDALAVLANQNAPCTDLLLWFGDLEPGQEVTRTGHILIAETDLKSFQQQADAIIQRLDEIDRRP